MTDREAVSRELAEELGWEICDDPNLKGYWVIWHEGYDDDMVGTWLPNETRDKLISLRCENAELKEALRRVTDSQNMNDLTDSIRAARGTLGGK